MQPGGIAAGIGPVVFRRLPDSLQKMLDTPLSYLTHWRIGKAKEILSVNKGNIRDVAAQVGYQSEAALGVMALRTTHNRIIV
jgi:AraC-like DNA-binding protein